VWLRARKQRGAVRGAERAVPTYRRRVVAVGVRPDVLTVVIPIIYSKGISRLVSI
jgi:hypothetical protein